jgi:GT2 family glycosyltransferase
MPPVRTDTVYDVAVILINYNSSEHTIACLSSILKHTSDVRSYGIVIIDNASEQNDFRQLAEHITEVDHSAPLKLFRSRINTGFAGGNMLGAQFINANYYFFLNNDCRLQNDCVDILFRFCEVHGDTALCSPQLYHEDGSHQPCFDYFPYLITKLFGLSVLRLSYGKRYIKRKGIYSDPVQVDVVSGSQMFVRASAFDAIGGFDTTFFLYCEEEDIALRLARAGHKTYLVPEARNIHIGGGSTVASLDIRREFYISFLYFYRKHFGLIRQQLLKLILSLRLLRKGLSTPDNFRLALFVASGAHFKHSLKHKQKLQPMVKPCVSDPIN